MTREEAVGRIDQAAEEKLTELDLAGRGLEELPPEIGKCTQLETLVLGNFDIVATATAIGVGIAGVTDFANTAIDLGQKLGIELNLPSGR
ncbi:MULTISPECIES: hypothetical protein [unclassified Microcoleus]|uniref:hypothetical protein n=1 Tax=unclassified Microcoleus TaxID=2642155 RepID=UPI002FD1A379